MSLPAEEFIETIDYVMALLDDLPSEGIPLNEIIAMADNYAKLHELRGYLERAAQLMKTLN